jgi:hypothetical protein
MKSTGKKVTRGAGTHKWAMTERAPRGEGGYQFQKHRGSRYTQDRHTNNRVDPQTRARAPLPPASRTSSPAISLAANRRCCGSAMMVAIAVRGGSGNGGGRHAVRVLRNRNFCERTC